MHDDQDLEASSRQKHPVSCPNCKRQVMISVDDTGLRVRCSNCGTTFDENGLEV